ncbi:related to cytosine deaminase and related metal-dependent hydrolases [Cephalotrichum gorgonifer]|uniref:Related to cytosine deaminase and related metal-dependent hydrolases n=1 Tax=Cephalotrichum gorgonifer TaxID=2041049 RepID=A0AAE8MYQ2_9PEZI|nr:related to cytosine deaminase and related metal-dependent hydrolases [Cephalotrichum gorgonifer]
MAGNPISRTLLKGGLLLTHGEDNHVHPVVSDLLIEDSIITQISPQIELNSTEPTTRTIDCTGKIISPGFISTHHHLYQTQFKGKHANHTLLKYFPGGHYASSLFTLSDLFWGELGGALEALDAGTTTVVDHSNVNHTPDYPRTAIQALLTSGLRTVYCYTFPRRVSSWAPFAAADDMSSPWVLDTFASLAESAPFDGRVHLGFGTDNVFLPAEVMKPMFARIRAAPARLITLHGAAGPAHSMGPGKPAPSIAQMLELHGLLGPDILVSHANYPRAEGAVPGMEADAKLFGRPHEVAPKISSTPNTELQMGWPPVALMPEYRAVSSLGVDCHSWGSGYMPLQMNLLLQHARNERAVGLAREDKWSRNVGYDVEDVFNLGTIDGARAIGLEGEVGQIKVGLKADLVVFDTDTPTMLAAAVEDPVAAVVLHSSPRDISFVIADGVVRKEGGKLVDVEVAPAVGSGEAESVVAAGTKLSWGDIGREILRSRESLKKKLEGIDMVAAEDAVMAQIHMNKVALID